MKKLMFASIAVCVALASCGGGGSKNMKSYSTLDSLSYAAGVQFATNLRMQDSTLVGPILAQAWRDVFAGEGKMTLDEAYAFINEWFGSRLPAKTQAESQEWLAQLKADNPNIQTTSSGLMYEIIKAGDPAVRATNDADQVVVKYVGSLRDGTVFDSNDSISIPLNRVIAGWTEGMKLVGKGGEIVLWIPSDLGYGTQQQGAIPGNSALKFEVTMHDVIPAPAESAQ